MHAARLVLIVLILFAGIASVLYRLQKTKPIMKAGFPQPRFSEVWCSGRSDRNTLARLLIAKNILWVMVTKDELHVSPHFPFSLMFFPEAFGLDHRVPGKNILHLREVSSTAGKSSVVVRYRHATGDEEHLQLWIDDLPTFMTAIAAIQEEMSSDGSMRHRFAQF